MYKHILCTLDGSPLAEKALPHALALAQAFQARLTLLRVVEMPPVPIMPEAASVEINLLPYLMEDAQTYLNAKREEVRQTYPNTEAVVMEGRAAETIADYAAEHDVDLIVMATHGRSGLSRLAFGSVADRVLRTAGCPVLLVRASEA